VTGERLAWKNLRDQFGQEYSAGKTFKPNMSSVLRAVLAVYPDARISEVEGGLILLPSKPPVPKTVLQVGTIQETG
jgi:hypothetical protein